MKAHSTFRAGYMSKNRLNVEAVVIVRQIIVWS